MSIEKKLKSLLAVPSHIFYHVIIIAVSAAIALSLPFTVGIVAQEFLVYWAYIGNEKIFLLTVEIATAVLLILFFNYIGSVMRDRRLAGMARLAGLVSISSSRGVFAARKNRRFKESRSIARDVMVIGSTGYRTFVDERGDLHRVIRDCREAKIMLLNPYGEGAGIRAKSIMDPEITPERFREQIWKSITYLKELKALQKNIRLKLYSEPPFLKLAVSGDYAWMKHYHSGIDVQELPEYVFWYGQKACSLYVFLYQYFLNQWNDSCIPEYDLDTDELVYWDGTGHEERRVNFREMTGAATPSM